MIEDTASSNVEPSCVDAGDFALWMHATQQVLTEGAGSDVPCGSCAACCRSSFFIHVDPDEVETISSIPVEFRFPAPGCDDGTILLGFDELGRCPMLRDDGCAIYSNRPRACRMFDCRVFAATGVSPEKPLIAEMTDRWRFSYAGAEARSTQKAVKAAGAFLLANPQCFPGGSVPVNPGQPALLALTAYRLFLERETEASEHGEDTSDVELCNAIRLTAQQGCGDRRRKR